VAKNDFNNSSHSGMRAGGGERRVEKNLERKKALGRIASVKPREKISRHPPKKAPVLSSEKGEGIEKERRREGKGYSGLCTKRGLYMCLGEGKLLALIHAKKGKMGTKARGRPSPFEKEAGPPLFKEGQLYHSSA